MTLHDTHRDRFNGWMDGSIDRWIDGSIDIPARMYISQVIYIYIYICSSAQAPHSHPTGPEGRGARVGRKHVRRRAAGDDP